MFRTAVAEELLSATPCVLLRGTLPKKVDKDPEWRHTAIFTREELARLVSDPRLLPDRRMVYALKGLAGLRQGETSSLRWRQIDDATLGMRPRRGHDLRRTFITLAQTDGANRDALQCVTHGPRGDIVSLYTTFPWPALCAAVAVLKVPKVEELGTGFGAVRRKNQNRWPKAVTPPGLEPGFSA